jgi:hypothetical protein
MQIKGPSGKVMYEIVGGVDDEFSIVADVPGEYTMCFENQAGTPTSKDEKHVSFNSHVGSEGFLKQAASIKDAEVVFERHYMRPSAVLNGRVCCAVVVPSAVPPRAWGCPPHCDESKR